MLIFVFFMVVYDFEDCESVSTWSLKQSHEQKGHSHLIPTRMITSHIDRQLLEMVINVSPVPSSDQLCGYTFILSFDCFSSLLTGDLIRQTGENQKRRPSQTHKPTIQTRELKHKTTL